MLPHPFPLDWGILWESQTLGYFFLNTLSLREKIWLQKQNKTVARAITFSSFLITPAATLYQWLIPRLCSFSLMGEKEFCWFVQIRIQTVWLQLWSLTEAATGCPSLPFFLPSPLSLSSLPPPNSPLPLSLPPPLSTSRSLLKIVGVCTVFPTLWLGHLYSVCSLTHSPMYSIFSPNC